MGIVYDDEAFNAAKGSAIGTSNREYSSLCSGRAQPETIDQVGAAKKISSGKKAIQ
jgi:hypothetical protein